MGIMVLYQSAQLISSEWAMLPYCSILVSLNVLLTLMIVVRLILHTRSVRTVIKKSGIGGLYKAIIVMLVESCALFAVSVILFIGLPWGSYRYAEKISKSVLSVTQVCASPRLRSSGNSSDMVRDRTGYRPPAGHSASRR